jgi:pentatricopeptide repeat protein
MGRLTKQGLWAVSLEVFRGLPELGIQMDTAICNAALAACMRGSAWGEAKAVFELMAISGVVIDHITYSTMLSVPRRRRLWPVIIDVRFHL